MKRLREREDVLFFGMSTLLLVGGGVAWLLGETGPAGLCWMTGTVLGLGASIAWMVSAIRSRHLSVDVIAVMALAGTLAVDEPFAGAVITVMLASGRLLEARAAARARRELGLLLERSPRTALRRVAGGVAEIPVEAVVRGDRLLVGTGGLVPVDGRLLTEALLDESALTGEPLPVERPAGDDVRSGVVNAGMPVDMVATAVAAESTYAGVVRLVEQAQAASAPFVRVADRLAVFFVPLTLLLAGAAWALSGDPVRAVAVLVVATPCPLLLAAPIAIMSGLSRAARVGVVIKGGGALERLAAGRVMLFDKTGTLTQGRPVLADVDHCRRAGWTPTSCCGWPRRWTRCRRTCSPVPSSAPAARRGLALEMPAGGHGGARLRLSRQGRRRTRSRLGKASWIVPGQSPRRGCASCAGAPSLDGSLTVFMRGRRRAGGGVPP